VEDFCFLCIKSSGILARNLFADYRSANIISVELIFLSKLKNSMATTQNSLDFMIMNRSYTCR
jgi:hypothetical protein